MKGRTRFLMELAGQQTTRDAYEWQLDCIAADLAWPFSLNEYVTWLNGKGWGHQTMRQNLSALKAFLKWAKVEHPILGLKIEKPKEQGELPRVLKLHQRDTLLIQANGYMKPRNVAIIHVLWATGVRLREVCRIKRQHLDFEKRILRVLTKAANMKPRKWEYKSFKADECYDAIVEWLAVAPESDYLFCSKDGDRLQPEAISSLFKRLSAKVGFKVSCHDFRRGASTHAAEEGLSPRLIMAQFGWETPYMLVHYTRQMDVAAFGKQMWGEQ